jgi:hypothetical protein
MIGTARQRIVRAMRRALVLLSILAAWLLLVAPGLAPAAPRALKPQPEEQEDLIFGLEADGFAVSVFAEDNDGDQTASLTISRDGLSVEYLVPATITDDSVKAKFGALGNLDYSFKPKKAKGKCHAGLTFDGTFTFTGENGYVLIDADHAEGGGVEQDYSGCPGRGGHIVVARSTGFHLEAIAGSWTHGTARRVQATEYRTRGGRSTVNISAFVREEREGMLIGDGAMVTAPASAFRRNVKAGTATLTPPAPFTGSATLKPGRGGKGIWEGTLQLPSLRGGAPIAFTGPEFGGRVEQEQPYDE